MTIPKPQISEALLVKPGLALHEGRYYDPATISKIFITGPSAGDPHGFYVDMIFTAPNAQGASESQKLTFESQASRLTFLKALETASIEHCGSIRYGESTDTDRGR